MNQKSSWHKLTLNPKLIERIYDDVPLLESVSFVNINFIRDAAMIILLLELPSFPKHPPVKWIEKGFNTIQIKLNCIEVEFVELIGWGHNIIGDLKIYKIDDLLILECFSETFKVKIKCKFLDISDISAYISN